MAAGRDQMFEQEARRRAQEQEQLRRALERCAQFPNEVHSVLNCGTGIAQGENGHSVFQVVKADGCQLHVDIHPQGRRELIRALQEEEERVAREGGANGSSLLTP